MGKRAAQGDYIMEIKGSEKKLTITLMSAVAEFFLDGGTTEELITLIYTMALDTENPNEIYISDIVKDKMKEMGMDTSIL